MIPTLTRFDPRPLTEDRMLARLRDVADYCGLTDATTGYYTDDKGHYRVYLDWATTPIHHYHISTPWSRRAPARLVYLVTEILDSEAEKESPAT